jgi:transposase
MDEGRLVLTDEAWTEIAEVLQRAKRADGRPAVQSDRMFLEAVLYTARTGIPWRDLPACFGKWDAVYNRFRRWEQSGVWRKLWEGLQDEKFKSAKHIFIDSTIVRAHQHAAGALKKTTVVKVVQLRKSQPPQTSALPVHVNTKINCAVPATPYSARLCGANPPAPLESAPSAS